MHILYVDKTDPRTTELLTLLENEKFSIKVESNSSNLTLEPATSSAARGGKMTTLTKKEFLLVSLLSKHEGQPVARDTIIREVWNMSIDPFSNTLEAHIRSLRKKLGEPNIIHTVPRIGYKMSPLP